MMSTIIFSAIGKDINNVVEIGAGFGNWARLNNDIINFNKWTMIDLEFVTKLQKWYINQTVTNSSNIDFVSVDTPTFNPWASNLKEVDLVIGSHSLSEVSIEVFNLYYDTVLPKTRYFFYAAHKSQPSKKLLHTKLKMIAEKFNIITEVESSEGKVINILYEKKNG